MWQIIIIVHWTFNIKGEGDLFPGSRLLKTGGRDYAICLCSLFFFYLSLRHWKQIMIESKLWNNLVFLLMLHWRVMQSIILWLWLGLFCRHWVMYFSWLPLKLYRGVFMVFPSFCIMWRKVFSPFFFFFFTIEILPYVLTFHFFCSQCYRSVFLLVKKLLL